MRISNNVSSTRLIFSKHDIEQMEIQFGDHFIYQCDSISDNQFLNLIKDSAGSVSLRMAPRYNDHSTGILNLKIPGLPLFGPEEISWSKEKGIIKINKPSMKVPHQPRDHYPKENYNGEGKRKSWTKELELELKKYSSLGTPVSVIAKNLDRTQGAIRQKGFQLNLPLGHRNRPSINKKITNSNKTKRYITPKLTGKEALDILNDIWKLKGDSMKIK
jgi:hypothetical protein